MDKENQKVENQGEAELVFRARIQQLERERRADALLAEQAAFIQDRRAVELTNALALLADAIFLAKEPHSAGCSSYEHGADRCDCALRQAVAAFHALAAKKGDGFVRNCGTCYCWQAVAHAASGGLVRSSLEGLLGFCNSPVSPFPESGAGDGISFVSSWDFVCGSWGMRQAEGD